MRVFFWGTGSSKSKLEKGGHWPRSSQKNGHCWSFPKGSGENPVKKSRERSSTGFFLTPKVGGRPPPGFGSPKPRGGRLVQAGEALGPFGRGLLHGRALEGASRGEALSLSWRKTCTPQNPQWRKAQKPAQNPQWRKTCRAPKLAV